MLLCLVTPAFVWQPSPLRSTHDVRATTGAATQASLPTMMVWVDDQHSQGKSWIVDAEEMDVSLAADAAALKAGPKPSLEPAEIVELMLKGFQRGSNDDIEDLFQFVHPTGDLASAHQSSAGAMSSFRWKIRKEPRWKNMANRPHAALLHMRSFEVVGGLMTDPDIRVYMVRAQPFFPDAPHAESDVNFQFEVVRIGKSSHPDFAEIDAERGMQADCWMVNRIEPKYEDWAVRDPINAGRCPDTFKAPKRSAEDPV